MRAPRIGSGVQHCIFFIGRWPLAQSVACFSGERERVCGKAGERVRNARMCLLPLSRFYAGKRRFSNACNLFLRQDVNARVSAPLDVHFAKEKSTFYLALRTLHVPHSFAH